MRILLYAGPGTSKRSLKYMPETLKQELESDCLSIALTDAEQLVNKNWEASTDLFIIPGGRDVPYHQALSGAVNARIREYILNGGNYLGICAGAYYACNYVEFDKGERLEVCGERELKFFPDKAIGPAYGPNSYVYDSEAGARASKISWEEPGKLYKEQFVVYHNGGCYFNQAEKYPEVKILAKYDDLDQRPAAIIECSMGKGLALLSGVHMECRAKELKGDALLAKSIFTCLKENESKTVDLFSHCLARFNL